ncbi:T9SS type A sorting domain-containing protein [Bacteroidales bacterium]|nr:T9SS type A sorting domain-containing protein [Bacteroidales bacterium]
MYKILIIPLLVWLSINIHAQNIIALEYSIDEFVTGGNGTRVPATGTSQSIDQILDIDISDLPEGRHTILIRSLNSDNVWSLPMKSSFYIAPRNPHPKITHIEYSIDDFVTEGKGTLVEILTDSNAVDSSIAINISGLPEGIHTIYSRTRNENGVWGLPMEGSFYVKKSVVPQITSIHYRVFNDQTDGEWKVCEVIIPSTHIDTVISIPTTDLDIDSIYQVEAYAVNSKQVRGFSAYANFTLRLNNVPEKQKSTLPISMFEAENVKVSMDTLFSDADIIFGDSLSYTYKNTNGTDEFSSWFINKVLEFTPGNEDAGTYNFEITATDMNGASVNLPVSLTVHDVVGINEISATENITVFPNPANDYISITGISAEASIQVFNIHGQLIMTKAVRADNISLNIEALPPGAYYVLVKTNNNTVNQKIMVK